MKQQLVVHLEAYQIEDSFWDMSGADQLAYLAEWDYGDNYSEGVPNNTDPYAMVVRNERYEAHINSAMGCATLYIR